MNKKGQIFSLDLFISLIILVVIVSFSTVLIDNAIDQAFNELEFTKMQSLAMDLATYGYYNPGSSLPKISSYEIGFNSKPGGIHNFCVTSIRGTGDNQVKVYVCR